MKILHVCSSFAIEFPGGITNYLRTLANSQVRAGNLVYVIDGSSRDGWEILGDGYRVRGTRASRQRAHVASMPEDESDSEDLLETIREGSFDLVHFHLTIGLGLQFYRSFDLLDIPYVVSFHDYFLFCPRIYMMDWKGENCGGPEPDKCARCVSTLDQVDIVYRAGRKLNITIPRIGKSQMVAKRNDVVGRFLRKAGVTLAVSERVKELFNDAYPDLTCEVLHIGTASANAARSPKVPSNIIRVAYMGTLATHKGAAIFETLARRVRRADMVFEFWGRIQDPRWRKRMIDAGVELKGPYTAESLGSIMASIDLGIVPPVWEDNAPQVVMEFINHAVPVMGTRIGGIPDFVSAENGYLFDPSDAGIQEAVSVLSEVTQKDLRVLAMKQSKLTTPEEHAEQIARIYARVVKGSW